jgi:hypothetical protein
MHENHTAFSYPVAELRIPNIKYSDRSWMHCPTELPRRIIPQAGHADLCRRLTPQTYAADLPRRLIPQTYPADLSRRIVPQTYPADLSHRTNPTPHTANPSEQVTEPANHAPNPFHRKINPLPETAYCRSYTVDVFRDHISLSADTKRIPHPGEEERGFKSYATDVFLIRASHTLFSFLIWISDLESY